MTEPRGWLVTNRRWFPLDGKAHRIWWRWSDSHLYPLLRLWRPLCWLNGAHDRYYGHCALCLAPRP